MNGLSLERNQTVASLRFYYYIRHMNKNRYLVLVHEHVTNSGNIFHAGRYPCEMASFKARVAHNQWNSLYVLIESVACIHLVVEECLKVKINFI